MRTHCVRNWIQGIKTPAHFQLTHRKSAAILRFQLLGKVFQEKRTIISPFLAFLFLYLNAPPDVSIHLNAAKIYATDSIPTRLLNDSANIKNKVLVNSFNTFLCHKDLLQLGIVQHSCAIEFSTFSSNVAIVLSRRERPRNSAGRFLPTYYNTF